MTILKKRSTLDRIKYLVFSTNTEPMRVWLALGSLLWGILLFLPGTTFDYPEYSIMRKFASEEGWALYFSLQGIFSMFSVITGYKSRLLFVLEPFFGTILWTVSGLSLMLSLYPPPADCAATLAASIMSFWLMVRYKFPQTAPQKSNKISRILS